MNACIGCAFMNVDANHVVNEHDLAMVISQIVSQQALTTSTETASEVTTQSGIIGPLQYSLASTLGDINNCRQNALC